MTEAEMDQLGWTEDQKLDHWAERISEAGILSALQDDLDDDDEEPPA